MKEKLVYIAKLFLALIAIDSLAGYFIVGNPFENAQAPLAARAARSAVSGVLALLFYNFYLRKFAESPPFSLGRSLRYVSIGCASALLATLLILAIAIGLSSHRVYFEWPQLYPALILLMFQIGTGTMEEALCRGVLQNTLEKIMPVALATVVQVGTFVSGHDFQNNATPIIYFMILVIDGLLLTLLAKVDSSLVLAASCHAILNWCNSVVLGSRNHYILIESMWDSSEPIPQEVYPVVSAIMLIGWCIYFKRFRNSPSKHPAAQGTNNS